ncbi:hypothetical protein D3C78_1537420 [compost metagenome]
MTPCVDSVATPNVRPSPAARAMSAMPMEPPAPARFSMTTVWPSRRCKGSCRERPAMSVAPPGGKGTTMRRGLSWARDSAGRAAEAAMAARA